MVPVLSARTYVSVSLGLYRLDTRRVFGDLISSLQIIVLSPIRRLFSYFFLFFKLISNS